MGRGWISQPSSTPALLLLLLHSSAIVGAAAPGSYYDYGSAQPRFVCTPVPADADPACFPPHAGAGGAGPGGPVPHGAPGGLWGMTEEAKTTILHLRESLVQQRETLLDQRETIRELTAKLAVCEGFGRGAANDHYGGSPSHPPSPSASPSSPHHAGPGGRRPNDSVLDAPDLLGGRGKDKHATPGEVTSPGGVVTSPEQTSRMLDTLRERLESLQWRNSSTSSSSSLKELLQRKINALEQQRHHHTTAALGASDHRDDDGSRHDNGTHRDAGHRDDHLNDRHDDDSDGRHEDYDDHGDHDDSNETDSRGFALRTGVRAPGPRAGPLSDKLESALNHLHRPGSRVKKPKSPDAFQISFPMRTNYMYGRVKRTLLHEIFAFTLCLWMKGDAGPGLGTPFSYSVPGQANELVLIEWGDNPMELLVDDQAVTLPLSLGDGKWHHVCVTWSTRDGQWEAYQDGVRRGSGEGVSAWHPIRPGGVFILGQEQDTLGGRFDTAQSFVGEMSDLQMWSSVLTASDVYDLASCGRHLSGDVFSWSEAALELHGGVTRYPFDPCH